MKNSEVKKLLETTVKFDKMTSGYISGTFYIKLTNVETLPEINLPLPWTKPEMRGDNSVMITKFPQYLKGLTW